MGTALESPGSAGAAWFTIARGVLTEVFYPDVDTPGLRDLGLIVTDGRDFVSDEKDDAETIVQTPADGVLLHRLTNTCRRGRYRIEKSVFVHPEGAAIVQEIEFQPLAGSMGDYRVFVLVDPQLENHGAGNTAWLGESRGVPILFASRGASALALASSAPWNAGSAGFVGKSDGRADLVRHGRLTKEYDLAEDGNVALVGEVDLASCDGRFRLVLGLGRDPEEAAHRAVFALLDDPGRGRAGYVGGWRSWVQKLAIPEPPGGSVRNLGKLSASVLKAHEDRNVPGAFAASLSIPWGEERGDGSDPKGTGGYHLVWPRDLAETAGGLLAVGAKAEAVRALRYLRATQRADGHWPQNLWTSGAEALSGIQIGETALPLILLDLARREGAIGPEEAAGFWPMAKRAAGYILRSGPSTQEDRWENQRGYTPFTLSAAIAAFLIAADLAEEFDEPGLAPSLREAADLWNAAIDSWLFITDSDLARQYQVEGYYARIIPPELDLTSAPSERRLRWRGKHPVKAEEFVEVVSPDVLALVRFGLRPADDPRIVDTMKVVDGLLKVETPRGPSWRRYNGDLYGEAPDGSPFTDHSSGVGRAWPLLSGERGHYELQAGRPEEAARLLLAMERLAGDSGMIPEQVWDAKDIPERGLFLGRPTGSAMPLAWAHAEYLKLRRSLADGRAFDVPPQTVRRYVEGKAPCDRAAWRFDHPRGVIASGECLRLEVLEPAVVAWSADGRANREEIATTDSGLGLHVADLPTRRLAAGTRIVFTFRWMDADRRENRDFEVAVIDPESRPRPKGRRS